MGSKVKYLNFAITLAFVNIFYWNFPWRQRYNKYETYQTWFSIQGLGPTPLVDLGGGVKRSKFNFSEHGHVAYQIKGNQVCSNMVANILIVDLYPSPPLPNPKTAYQIIGKKVCSNMVSKYFCPQPPSPPPPPPPPNPLTLYIKHIQHDFRSKAWVRPTCWT